MESKIRLRFSKTDTLRFIGHLDFLRVFQQAIRRSGLPIAYSQGFNPHQIISFALPLPLGMESVNDYADITLAEQVSCGEIVKSLNGCAPGGLRISSAYEVKGVNAAAATIAADYEIVTSISIKNYYCEDIVNEKKSYAQAEQEKLLEAAKKILNCETLIIPKKTKSGIKNTDIRPDIFEINVNGNNLTLRLSAGSARFLNPILAAEQIMGKIPCASSITRLELFQTDGKGGFTPL